MRLPVAAGQHQAEAAVRRNAGETVRNRVADHAGDVGADSRIPDRAVVVEEALVVEREITCAHTTSASGHTDRAGGRIVEAEQRGWCHFGDRKRVNAEGRADLLRRGHVAHGHELGDVVLLIHRNRQQTGETGGSGDPVLHDGAEVDAGHTLDDLGQHPVRAGGVVFERRARLPVSSATGAKRAVRPSDVAPTGIGIGAWGKPEVCSMTCSTVILSLPFAPNIRDVMNDRKADIYQPVADERPYRAGDERLRAGKHRVARVEVGVAERFVGDQLAVERERHLSRWKQTLVDLLAGSGN